MPVLSAEEEDAVERLVETAGWKVFMVKILFPMLHLASNKVDMDKYPDFLEARGRKTALRDVIAETYAKIRQKSPFDEHLEALLLNLSYTLDKKEPKIEENAEKQWSDMLNRHSEGSKPLGSI